MTTKNKAQKRKQAKKAKDEKDSNEHEENDANEETENSTPAASTSPVAAESSSSSSSATPSSSTTSAPSASSSSSSSSALSGSSSSSASNGAAVTDSKEKEKEKESRAAAAVKGLSKAERDKRVQDLKEKGNFEFTEKNYDKAIEFFDSAVQIDPENAVLYSNRSACFSMKMDFDHALVDAEKVISLQPKWTKGYLRKGAALDGLLQLPNALEVYKAGLKIDPNDLALKKAAEELMALMEEMKASQNELSATTRANPEQDRFEALLQWLRDGNAKFPYLYMRYYDEDYRGVHSKCRIATNKIILEVPLSHIMTSELAKSSPFGKKIISSGCELSSTHSFLASFLLQEKHNSSSKWQPYIRILPQNYRNMPIFFDEIELKELKGSFTIRKIADRQEELKEEYDNICRFVPEFKKFSHAEFVWARLVVITRIFGLVINGNKTDGLVPMADMLNHKRPRETSWTFDDSRNAFTITSLKAIERGDQIYDSYGRKCNSRFFVNYGFSLEENKEDNQAVVFCEIPHQDGHYAMKLRLLGGPSQAGRRRFQCGMDPREKVTKELFSFLRFAHAKDSEFLLLSSDKEFNIKEINPISVRNELEVLNHIKKISEESLSLFEHSLEEDYRILKEDEEAKKKTGKSLLTMNIRNAILMRKGEKEVLHYFINLLAIVEPLTKMAWKDFKKAAAKFFNIPSKAEWEEQFVAVYITTCIVPIMKAQHQQ